MRTCHPPHAIVPMPASKKVAGSGTAADAMTVADEPAKDCRLLSLALWMTEKTTGGVATN